MGKRERDGGRKTYREIETEREKGMQCRGLKTILSSFLPHVLLFFVSSLYTHKFHITSLQYFFYFLLELFPLSSPFTPGRDLGIGACLGSLTPSGIFSGFGTNNDPGTFVLLLILLSFIISYVRFY